MLFSILFFWCTVFNNWRTCRDVQNLIRLISHHCDNFLDNSTYIGISANSFSQKSRTRGVPTFSGHNLLVFSDIKKYFGRSLENNWVKKPYKFIKSQLLKWLRYKKFKLKSRKKSENRNSHVFPICQNGTSENQVLLCDVDV